MRDSLDAIGIRTGTDKSSVHHNFLHLYEKHLLSSRDSPITLLEIGIHKGGSIRMWREYFSAARIIGVDINPTCVALPNLVGIETHVVDQSNVFDLMDLGRRCGPFDVIVDDGSHWWDHQIATLQVLFPMLNPGGIYILEDLDTSYGSFAATFGVTGGISAADYLRKITDRMVGDRTMVDVSEPDRFIWSFAKRIQYVVLAPRTALIQTR